MEEIKCAIYTRKSTDEGLEKEFNTLEAQREAGENFVNSQKHQGWKLIDEHYDDGGFSGGNMNRPSLQRLLKDVEAGKVNMIVVYKIDRLSRSLTDFSKMVELFDKCHCSFVSVTQNFNTADSMGRLTLNMLLSFAQFEREISGERIRDKVAASKKKGIWMGGCCHALMTPTTTQSHGFKRYYYTSVAARMYGHHKCSNGSVPVAAMDECMIKIVAQLFQDPKVFHALLDKVAPNKTLELLRVLHTPEKVFYKLSDRHKHLLMELMITGVTVNRDTMEINWTDLGLSLLSEHLLQKTTGHQTIMPMPFIKHKGRTEIHLPENMTTEPHNDNELIKAICLGFKYQKMLDQTQMSITELAIKEDVDATSVGRFIRLTCLSPAIVRTILKGHQPPKLYLRNLLRHEIPPIWEDQKKLFGFTILD